MSLYDFHSEQIHIFNKFWEFRVYLVVSHLENNILTIGNKQQQGREQQRKCMAFLFQSKCGCIHACKNTQHIYSIFTCKLNANLMIKCKQCTNRIRFDRHSWFNLKHINMWECTVHAHDFDCSIGKCENAQFTIDQCILSTCAIALTILHTHGNWNGKHWIIWREWIVRSNLKTDMFMLNSKMPWISLSLSFFWNSKALFKYLF